MLRNDILILDRAQRYYILILDRSVDYYVNNYIISLQECY